MKQQKRFLTLTCTLALVTAACLGWLTQRAAVHAYEGEAYAIRGATIVTVSGATIPKGNVVVRNGLIEAVGADVAIPGDAKIIEGTGLTVYPGLFDANSNLGLPAPTPQAGGGGRGGGAPADPDDGVYDATKRAAFQRGPAA